MPLEWTGGLEKAWPELLLLLGWILTAASGVAIALCVLGGCLDALERRRVRRVERDRRAVGGQPLSALQTTASGPSPVSPLPTETRPAGDEAQAFGEAQNFDEAQAFLCDDMSRELNRALPQLR